MTTRDPARTGVKSAIRSRSGSRGRLTAAPLIAPARLVCLSRCLMTRKCARRADTQATKKYAPSWRAAILRAGVRRMSRVTLTCLSGAPTSLTHRERGMTPHIKIYRFDDAPQHLKDLSTNGGDEDWIAVLPQGWEVPLFLEDNQFFGCCSIDRREHCPRRWVLWPASHRHQPGARLAHCAGHVSMQPGCVDGPPPAPGDPQW